MLFTSWTFIGFAAAVILLYRLVSGRLQWPLLLAADVNFYACAGWQGLAFLAALSAVTWGAVQLLGQSFTRQRVYLASPEGKTLSREERKQYRGTAERERKHILIAALVLILGCLAVIKYTNFLLGGVNAIAGTALSVDFFVPMGISFCTFRAAGYVIDVYWEKTEPERSFAKTALFTSFFPLMVQGPICRFGDLRGSLFMPHRVSEADTGFGFQRILWGYFKKLVVADRLLPAVTVICSDAERFSGAWALLGALLYAAELYADFTGGIDITIGIAQMLGIPVQENFVRPFFSTNIAEYWRRWHISMGTWFKDYVFYPLSVSGRLLKLGKRVRKRFDALGKKLPVYIATLVTWFLTGLWHGAAWSFIVWGLLNAVLILAAEELKPASKRFNERFPKLAESRGWRCVKILRTFLLMCALRMLDCYGSVRTAFRAFFSVFTMRHLGELFDGSAAVLGLTGADWLIAACGVLLMFTVSLVQEKHGSVRKLLAEHGALPYALTALLLLTILVFGAYGIGYDSTQFIYNRF